MKVVKIGADVWLLEDKKAGGGAVNLSHVSSIFPDPAKPTEVTVSFAGTTDKHNVEGLFQEFRGSVRKWQEGE